MDDSSFVTLVLLTMEQRKELLIPQEFIVEAVQRIRKGKEKSVVFYPSEDPPFTDVLAVAKRLRDERMTRH